MDAHGDILNSDSLQGSSIHLAGIKGTGMCALTEILINQGIRVTGSDVDEEFYTDRILSELGVNVSSFVPEAIPSDVVLVIRSAAYDDSNPVVAEALRRGIPVLTYPEALGVLSSRYDSSAIAGVHGKTTTTALAGTLIRALNIRATVIAGSAVSGFGNRSTWVGGGDFLIAETCEYRRHFLSFQPRRIVLTSVESDHQDYYKDYDSIRNAFIEFVSSLPPKGTLIYCADDKGAIDVAEALAKVRPDVCQIPYGENAQGPWRVRFKARAAGENRFCVDGMDREFSLSVPGKHIVLDAVAALALTGELLPGYSSIISANAISSFRGSRRRSEIIGEVDGILLMDDYAHHPTAIKTTLAGLKSFFPNRRLVVDFMPHTYSRTAALLEEFSDSFSDADVLILHPIYASAREENSFSISGKTLWEKTSVHRPGKSTQYHHTFEETLAMLSEILVSGDLFITLGAGDNWQIGRRFLESSL